MSQKIERIKVGLLPEEPSPELLRWAVELEDESGFVFQKPHWFAIKASNIGVPTYVMPADSDILLHTHPNTPDYDHHFVPSANDFRNASIIAVNLIASNGGITQFWPVDEQVKKFLEFITINARLTVSVVAYEQMLKEKGIRYQVFPWEDLEGKSISDFSV